MSKQQILKSIEEPFLRTDLPEIRPGDTVKAHVKVREAGKERIQIFEGTVIAIKNGGIGETVVIRKISHGVGTERSFPVHSPMIAKFEVVRRGQVRRAKLYYLRGKYGKSTRIKEKR
jgi:large subunit ribosomal protein L19